MTRSKTPDRWSSSATRNPSAWFSRYFPRGKYPRARPNNRARPWRKIPGPPGPLPPPPPPPPPGPATPASPEGPIHRDTYPELAQRTRKLANALKKLGATEEDRIGTIAWNTYRHLEVYYASSGMGAICHTMNPRLPA
ncbi:AMP-binding protein, partial [Roseovarius indicus]|uniref:AMP-binding protein n=1 Tax=Roseovarius indicus TaxID=540747 RepID=UPI004057D997